MKEIFLLCLILSIGFILVVAGLVHKKLLREQHAILWLIFGAGMIVLSTNSMWLDRIASLLEVQYPPALLFFIGIMVCLVLILYLTVLVSKLSGRVVRLTQEVGILKYEEDKRE